MHTGTQRKIVSMRWRVPGARVGEEDSSLLDCNIPADLFGEWETQTVWSKTGEDNTTQKKQDTGVEPASSAWEADVLPMY